jgi:glutamine synthetase
MLAAGLDGVDQEMECPPPVNDLNIYEMSDSELSELGINQLPGSLAEALDALADDELIKAALGQEAYDIFERAKRAEWDAYRTCVTDWEVETYLETA